MLMIPLHFARPFRRMAAQIIIAALVIWSFSPTGLSVPIVRAAVPDPASQIVQRFTFADQKARCLKVEGTHLRLNVSDKNAYRMQFAEIEIYVHNPAGDQHSTFNIALGATVIASSSFEYIGWSTEKVNDGEWNSIPGSLGWSSTDDLTVDHSEWIQLNLGGSYTINKVDLYPRNDPGTVGAGFPVDFDVQVSDDITCATGWITVVERTNYPLPGDAGQSFNFGRVP